MPLLTIHHKTVYRYARPVAFGEHRIMLRPRDGHDLRVLDGALVIDPQPMSLRWIHDVFGNSVAIAAFDERADTLSFVSTATVEHNPADRFALTPDDPAYFYPFLYDDEEFPDLQQFITPQYGDPNGELSAWARRFLDVEAPTLTFKILSDMTHGIREAFSYRKRYEQGTQHPLDTLRTQSGTCRDYALFMIEALRRTARRTITHHQPCCRCVGDDEALLLVLLGACQRGDGLLAQTAAQTLSGIAHPDGLLMGATRFAEAFAVRGLMLPYRDMPAGSTVPDGVMIH